MALEFYRGSTPTIRFRPLGDVDVTTLGEPVVAISQELVTLTFENNVEDEEDRVVIDTSSNSISVTLTQEESIQLADGTPTIAQVTWYKYSMSVVDEEEVYTVTDVIKFPQHDITILPSVLDIMLPDDEDPVDEDPAEEIEYDTEDPIGTLVVDDGDGIEYNVPDYQEYYEDTTEPQPLETYLYSDGIVQPIPDDWEPGDDDE